MAFPFTINGHVYEEDDFLPYTYMETFDDLMTDLATVIPAVQAVAENLTVRERLTADRTYFIRTDGSDSNSGLENTAGGAFLTGQKAIDVILDGLDIPGGITVTVQLGDGTYNNSFGGLRQHVGAGSIVVQGNSGTPANVIIVGESGALGAAFASGGFTFTVKDMELRNPSNGHCLYARWGGVIENSNLRFGAASEGHITVSFGGIIRATGNSAIVGDAARHYIAHNGAIREEGTTVTLSGTPAFTEFAQANSAGQLLVVGATFSGAATGKRFSIVEGAYCNLADLGAAGLTHFPGDVAGTVESGGIYDNSLFATREKLLANRTYYVRADGNDNNNGLANTVGGAFLTLQKAHNVIFDALDLNGFNVTVQIGDATYTSGIDATRPQTGRGIITFQGNAASPGNVIISTTSAHCFRAGEGAAFTVKDLEMRTTTSGSPLFADWGGKIRASNVRFGASANQHVRAEDNGMVHLTGGYEITGSASGHWRAVTGGLLRAQAQTVTLTGGPAFSTFANAELCGIILVNGNSYVGAATGTRYNAIQNAVISTGGATLPGDVAGTTATGGQYT